MNERIRELALQSNPASKEIYESDNWKYNCAAWCAQDLEKFAGLIVQECVRYFNEDYQRDFDTLWREDLTKGVKEHFGIKDLEPQSAADRILSTIRKRN